ncbi:hypothetical protein C8R43DRAFT_517838 [Mycena crocata]|nr:hypothetical protein C8R43DRAFT_517838 [Mycena crocata]
MLQASAAQSCPHCLVPFDTVEAPRPPQIPSDLLTTNRSPLDPEIDCIESVITEKRARKTRLDAQIAAVQLSLETLTRKRSILEVEIHEHEGTLSPLRRMPPELLSLIFVLTHIRDKNPAPWKISQVCRRWQAIVSSQPSFWKSIIVDFGNGQRDSSTSKSGLETQLQRSGNSPLNILFKCRFSFWDYTKHELAILLILAKHCRQWEKVQMSCPVGLYSHLTGIRGQLPLLRELNLQSDRYRAPDREEEEDEVLSIDVFKFAPELERVSLNTGAGVTLVLPFSHLLQYVARSGWDTFCNALHSPSNLIECGLNLVGTSVPPTTTIALPNLLRLSLSASNLLEYLDTPNLQELYCRSYLDHLSSLCARRLLRLQKLVLLSASITDVAGILEKVPTITEIGLSIKRDSIDPLATVLTIRNESTDLAPTLQCITICSSKERAALFSTHSSASPLVIDMVESRWRGGQSRSITYPDPAEWMWGVDERLEPFQAEGLKVRVASEDDRYHLDMIPSHLLMDVQC